MLVNSKFYSKKKKKTHNSKSQLMMEKIFRDFSLLSVFTLCDRGKFPFWLAFSSVESFWPFDYVNLAGGRMDDAFEYGELYDLAPTVDLDFVHLSLTP